MPLYERIRELADNVRHKFQYNNTGVEKFLPVSKLYKLVDEVSVKTAFLDANISDTEEDLVNFVLSGARRLFLILILMTSKREEKLSLLRGLQRNEIEDVSLPIIFREDEEQSTSYGHPFEGGNGRPRFMVFNDWEPNDRDAFENYQWLLIAPVFGSSNFRFRFAAKQILPYLRVEPKPASSGFLGGLSRIEIHAAHMPTLQAYPNPESVTIAVKTIKDSDELAKYFDNEADNLERMRQYRSPHLVRPIAVYQIHQDRCLMFPWADGGNLRNYWEKRGGEPQERSSLQWILGQFVGISSALEVLHENESNCRHADLKPENILWFKDEVDEGTLRIVDLGLAASHEEEAHTKQRLGMPTKMLSGTSRYEPPETDQDWGNDKPRSRQYDIWSMGCIMLELLIYLIYGYNAIGTFQDKTEHFWCKSSKSERSVYYVHPYVDSCMRIMDVQLQGGTAYKDLLHLVQTRLLIVDFQGYRETARGLHMKIYDIYSRCQSEPLYLTPIRLEYPSSRIESWNIFGESTSKVVESQSSTEEYPRRDTGPSHLSCDEMEKLETWIVQVLTDDKIVSRRVGEQGNPASGSKVTVKVNIDMREFLEWIRSDYRGVSPLEVVTVTGTPTTAVAHKAGWYLDWRWPQSGRALLDGLAGLIEGNIYEEAQVPGRHRFQFKDPVYPRVEVTDWDITPATLQLSLLGDATDVASVAPPLAWIISAFRKPTSKRLMTSRAVVRYSDEIFSFKLRPLEEVSEKGEASCWHDILRRCVLAVDFPFPSRLKSMLGVELPLGLLLSISGVDYPIPHINSFYMKGQTSAIIPVRREYEQRGDHTKHSTVSNIQWHFIQASDGGMLSTGHIHKAIANLEMVAYNPSQDDASDYDQLVDNVVTEDARHFLGLYGASFVNVGASTSNVNFLQNARDDKKVLLWLPKRKFVWKKVISPSISFVFPGFGLGVSTTYEVVPREDGTLEVVIPEVDLVNLRHSVKSLTIIFDTNRRVAWLVPEICAILHLMRADATKEHCQINFPHSWQLGVSTLEVRAKQVISQPKAENDIISALELFRKYHSVLRQMKESPSIISSGQRRDNFGLRATSVLVGADFSDIIALSPSNRTFEVLETTLHSTNGVWVNILQPNASKKPENFKIVTLFYNNPNPAPITPYTGPSNTCQHWEEGKRPDEYDYLITRADYLQLLVSKNNTDPPMLSPSHYWIRSSVYPPHPNQCTRGQARGTDYCDMLQKISSEPPNAGAKPSIAMLEENPQAALIFGQDLPPSRYLS